MPRHAALSIEERRQAREPRCGERERFMHCTAWQGGTEGARDAHGTEPHSAEWLPLASSYNTGTDRTGRAKKMKGKQ